MQYRKFGNLDFKVSALGFGCMRFPQLDQDPANIDEKEAIKMLHHAVDQGVNYLDTAYPYHKGQSETLVGKALQGGYREKVKLATKLPIWLVKDKEDPDKFLNEQLKKLGVETVDFYLVHSLNKNLWGKAADFQILDFLDKALKDGRIQHAGFSFHDELSLFKEIVDAYPWTFCQIHLNHVDRHYQAGLEGLKYAAEKGMAVIVMEPLRGGKLAAPVPEDIMAIWDRAESKRTPVDWALRWLWSQEGVSTVLSGMSTMEQVQENIALASQPPLPLTPAERAIYDDVKKSYEEKSKVNCTGCGYCQPCDSGVMIPDILSLYNDVFMYGAAEDFYRLYPRVKEAKKDASQCSECGKCLEACPQQLPVMELLRDVEKLYEAREK
jgi:uncharacterized protein